MSSNDEMWPEGWDQAPAAGAAAGAAVAARPAQAPDPAKAAAAAVTDGMNGMASQATRVEAIRAAAEVMAQVQAAQAVPRKMNRAVDGIRQACKIPEFAEKAFYRYPKGKKKNDDTGRWETNYVTGVSVYLARELLRLFGNAQSGIAELSRDDGQGRSEMNAWAWDVEYNVRQSTTFLVPHARDKTVNNQHVRESFVDLREIYDNNANMGARRLRQMILAILPPWYVGMAADLCRATIAGQGATDADGKPVPLEVRLTDAADGFTTRWGVRLDAIEQKLGVPFDKWVEQDLATLRVLYRSISRGETTVDDEFPPAAPTDDELTAQASARAPDAEPVPAGVDPATGEVIAGAVPAQAPMPQPGERPPAAGPAAAEPPAGEAPAGEAPAGEPPARTYDWPEVDDLDGTVTKQTAGILSRKWQLAGWIGEDYRERRRVMAGVLAAGHGNPPLDFTTPGKITERNGRTAILTYDALEVAAVGAGETPGVRLQRFYDQMTARQQGQAGAATP